MTWMANIKSGAIHGGLVTLSTALALVLVEVALRFAGWGDLNLSMYPAGYFVADEQLGYDIAKNAPVSTHGFYEVFSNRFGCFDYERPVADGYALVVGDSFAWGYTPLSRKWTTILETLSGQFLLKCGVTGYGTEQALGKAKRVVAQIERNPGYLILLYTGNDLNDDFMFPHRTIIEGRLVATIKSVNLITGEKSSYTDDELKQRYGDFMNPTLARRLGGLLTRTATHRLYSTAKEGMRTSIDSVRSSTGNQRPVMPDRASTAYSVVLASYLHDDERPWFNALLERHKDTIRAVARYARSLNAKLLLIDADGTLEHERLRDVVRDLRNADGVYYYNLAADYAEPSRLPGDGHWDAEGNETAGRYIYEHFRKLGVFR